MAPLTHLTSCTPTESNLHFGNSTATAVSEPDPFWLLTFHAPSLMSLFHCLGHTKGIHMFCNKAIFYSEAFLVRRPTSKLEHHFLSATHKCLFNIFTTPLHPGDSSSIKRNTSLSLSLTLFRWPEICDVTNINCMPITTLYQCGHVWICLLG